MKRFVENVANFPHKSVITFVDADGNDAGTHSFQSLADEAYSMANALQEKHHLKPGDRVLMLYTPSLEFVSALAACLIAGIVPVPVCPPDPFNLLREMPRLNAITRDSKPSAILCNREYNRLRKLGNLNSLVRLANVKWPRLAWIETDKLKPGNDMGFRQSAFDPSDLAVLQYTSGSTGDPKGVMISHGNVEHQCQSNCRLLGLSMESRAVVWVPHYHDFGLISGIMSALYGNGHLYLMSPLSFVTRPSVWFDVMSRVAATHTASPNFGYELIISKSTPQQRQRWNLSSLRVAMSAAEPINGDTVRRFKESFAVSGFRPEAYCPSYGLAEHTVGVTVAGQTEAWFDSYLLERQGVARTVDRQANTSKNARHLIGCGQAVDVDLRIVDAQSRRELGPGRVGEIWVDSGSKAIGYYNREQETIDTFEACIKGDTSGKRYLRTADMGFIHEGELYVTGRLSEMIIIRGRNLFPQDIEKSILPVHEKIRPGCIVAAAIETNSDFSEDLVEGVALLVELKESKKVKTSYSDTELEQIRKDIFRTLSDIHQIVPARISLCRPGSVVKTTSGKLKRRSSYEKLRGGELEATGKLLLDWTRTASGDSQPEPTAAFDKSPEPIALEPGRDCSADGQDVEQALDRRLEKIDPQFRELIAASAKRFNMMAQIKQGRIFHPVATTLKGSLTVLPLATSSLEADSAGLDTNEIFVTGRTFPVLVRHANGVTQDDAAWDNRGATVRILDPAAPDTLDQGLLDLLLTTGSRFTSANALDFANWMESSRNQREQIVRERPHIGEAAWDMFRLPDAYNKVFYYSKAASLYVTAGGQRYYVRYRLKDPLLAEDSGYLEADSLLPPDRAERLKGERRPPGFLHERLRRDLSNSDLTYHLQIQLRPTDECGVDVDEVLDATRAWNETSYPWLDRAELRLGEIVGNRDVEALCFNPVNAPDELALICARAGDESASLNHMRSIIYSIAGASRTGQPIPAQFTQFLTEPPQSNQGPIRVAIIGGGVSGLTLARSLEARGHRVLVLESHSEVGGKARSIEVDGHVFDLGAHLCSRGYTNFGQLLDELAIETEAVSEVVLWDLDKGRLDTLTDPALRTEFMHYQRLKQEHFPDIANPGYTNTSPLLAQAAADFFSDNQLEALGRITAIGYTASGYGFFDDPNLPAYRVLKYAESATFCMPGDRLEFTTPANGFGPVWKNVAQELSDVRTGCDIKSIIRNETGVAIVTSEASYHADYAVVACQPDALTGAIDFSTEEQLIFKDVAYIDYVTIVIRASGLPTNGFFLVDNHVGASNTRGHTVAFHHRHADSNVYLFWAYTERGASDEAVMAPIIQDIRRMGGQLLELIQISRWQYLPHFDLQQAADGAYQRLEALQGKQHTFWTGSLFNFELVENNMRYANHVAAIIDQALTNAQPAMPTSQSLAQQSRPGNYPLHEQLKSASRLERAEVFIAYLSRQLAQTLCVPVATFRPEHHLLDLGLDSVRSVEVFDNIRRDSGIALAPLAIYEHSTIRALSEHLSTLYLQEPSTSSPAFTDSPTGTVAEVRLDPARPAYNQLLESSSNLQREILFMEMLKSLVSEHLSIPREQIDEDSRITEMGLDSLKSMEVFDSLMAQSHINLPPIVLFEHPTFRLLSSHLAREFEQHHPACQHSLPAPTVAAGLAPNHEMPLLLDRLECMEGAIREMSAQMTHVTHLLRGAEPDQLPYAAATPNARDANAAINSYPLVPNPWLRIHRRGTAPAEVRLFCFHSAGLDAAMYDVWASSLPLNVELCAVQLPGREPHQQEPIYDIQQLMPAIYRAISSRLDLPFALFGHSFGALTAYVFARYLKDNLRKLPLRLMVASFWAPEKWVCRPELTKMMENRTPPGLNVDQRIMDSWSYTPCDGLPFPISVFHGAQDSMVPQADIETWRLQSSEATDMHIVTGGHFQLVTDPKVAGIVNSLLALDTVPPPLAAVPHVQPETLTAGQATWVARHDARFLESADTRGSWNLWDLINIARITQEPNGEGEVEPEFPDVLALLLSMLDEEGTYGDWHSPFAYNNFVIATATLSTLLQWHGKHGQDYTRYFEGLQRQIIASDARRHSNIMRGIDLPYGKYFKFPGMFGESLVPAFESARLLELDSGLLAEDTRTLLQSYATEDALSSVDRYFRFGELALPFPECYPEHVILSERVTTFAERAYPEMPGFSAAFAARYFQITRSPKCRASLEQALSNGLVGGLRPAGKLQEVYFSLYYLNKADINLQQYYPNAMIYLKETQKAYGVGIDELSLDVDVDSTAIAMLVCARQGVNCIIENGSVVLEQMWDDSRKSYRSTLGYFFNINMLLLAARATITDPGATMAQKRAIWMRVREQLDERQWLSVDHISPLYLWESVISLLFEFESLFPELTTEHHHIVLDYVLDMQSSSGGFCSYYFQEADLEETALALLALKAARNGRLDPARQQQVDAAIEQAHEFLAPRFNDVTNRPYHYPEQWIGILMFSDPKIVESILVASLLKQPRCDKITAKQTDTEQACETMAVRENA